MTNQKTVAQMIADEKANRNYRDLYIATFEIHEDRVEDVCDSIDDKLYDADCFYAQNVEALICDAVDVFECNNKSYLKVYLKSETVKSYKLEDRLNELCNYLQNNFCFMYDDCKLFSNAELFV